MRRFPQVPANVLDPSSPERDRSNFGGIKDVSVAKQSGSSKLAVVAMLLSGGFGAGLALANEIYPHYYWGRVADNLYTFFIDRFFGAGTPLMGITGGILCLLAVGVAKHWDECLGPALYLSAFETILDLVLLFRAISTLALTRQYVETTSVVVLVLLTIAHAVAFGTLARAKFQQKYSY